ncbi:hypothetical protein K1T71_012119 [Dendrolimus kikuchii]|uniref:Uncharacterized protein n=1 Tax=Dendrolimus kikuchii TaxID=765133 RepID=A0ACC1CL24_9NEOP|nr:hypothetical protein K1T71_012119 [Dendrolimus kikuchii]
MANKGYTKRILNIYYQNVRGLRSKTNLFYNNVCNCSYDVIVLSETWLNNNILNTELFNDNYVVYRRDRDLSSFNSKKDGGGVLIAVTKSINSVRMREWESDQEDIWVVIKDHTKTKGKDLSICGVYLPPPINKVNLDNFIDNCNTIMDQNDIYAILLGDFNLGRINWQTLDNNSKKFKLSHVEQIFIDFCSVNNLHQHNNIKNFSGKMLDLILCNGLNCAVSEAMDILSNIDRLHPPLVIDVSLQRFIQLEYNINSRYQFSKTNFEAVNNYLNNINWHSLFSECMDINEMVNCFYDTLWTAIKLYTPIASFKRTRKCPIWFNTSLKNLFKEKENLRRRYKIYTNPLNELSLKCLKKRCDKLAKECYHKYLNSIESNIPKNPKYFWSFLKAKPSTGPDICNLFASFFASVYTCDSKVSNDDFRCLSTIPHNYSDHFSRLVLDRDTIKCKLNNLDKTKGAGLDGIPPTFITSSLGFNSPIPRLCRLYNKMNSIDIHHDSLFKFKKYIHSVLINKS